MNNQRSEKIITTILGSLEHLIEVQVDVRNDAALNELQNVVGLMFYRASECLKSGQTWAEYEENLGNEAIKPAVWREYLHGIDQNTVH